jgi:hypothetical protein
MDELRNRVVHILADVVKCSPDQAGELVDSLVLYVLDQAGLRMKLTRLNREASEVEERIVRG